MSDLTLSKLPAGIRDRRLSWRVEEGIGFLRDGHLGSTPDLTPFSREDACRLLDVLGETHVTHFDIIEPGDGIPMLTVTRFITAEDYEALLPLLDALTPPDPFYTQEAE